MIRVKIVSSVLAFLSIFISSWFDLIIFVFPLPLTSYALNSFPLGLAFSIYRLSVSVLDFVRTFLNAFMSKQIIKFKKTPNKLQSLLLLNETPYFLHIL